MKWVGIFLLTNVWSVIALAQIKITDGTTPTWFVVLDAKTITMTGELINESAQTDLSKATLRLFSTRAVSPEPIISISSRRPLTVNSLSLITSTDAALAANRTFRVVGDWTVTQKINFDKGKILVDKVSSSLGTLTYTGSDELVGSDESYVNGRIFVKGSKTFPIGNADGYFPVALDNGDANVPLGFEVVRANPTSVNFATSQTVKEIFPDRFWEFSVGGTGNSFAGSIISLSDNRTSFTTDGDPIILEKEPSSDQKSLGGSPNPPYFTSNSPMTSGGGKYYALAKSDEISVIIHKLITPDKDNKNDALYIQGIDAYPENEVTLLDRWGVVAANFKNFKNDQPENFKDLAIGNYICILKYKNGLREVNVKPQMITVLK